MRKVLFGIFAVFMSLSLAYGSGFLIQTNINQSSQSEEKDEDEDTNIKASGNWTSYASSGTPGDGSWGNPLLISTASQLAWYMNAVNGGSYNDANVQLNADIDLSAHYWTPIGIKGKFFTGSFYGNGHTIKGMYISNEGINLNSNYGRYEYGNGWIGYTYTRGIGLFGGIQDAWIDNLNVSGSISLTGSEAPNIFSSGADNAETYVGGVVGIANDSSLSSVTNSVNINSYRYSKDYPISTTRFSAGGIVGGTSGWTSLSGCINKGSIYLSVSSDSTNASSTIHSMGGIVGISGGGSVGNCYNTGSLTYSGTSSGNGSNISNLFVGGIVGAGIKVARFDLSTVSIYYSVSTGSISISGKCNMSNGAVSGILGQCSADVYLTSNYNYGSISISDIYRFCSGGILGNSTARTEVKGSANFGTLQFKTSSTAVEDRGFGGIVGYSGEGSTLIQDCANYGDVLASGSYNNKYIGGIVGHILNNGLVDKSLNYGLVNGGNCVGGIAGELGQDNSAWIGDNSKRNVGITNCVSYNSVRGNSSIGMIVGYMNSDSIYRSYYNYNSGGNGSGNGKGSGGCYGNSSSYLHSYNNFFYSSSSWSSGVVAGFNFSGFNRNVYTYYYNSPNTSSIRWCVSPAASKYYTNGSSKNMLDYTLVPMDALAPGSVNGYWRGAGSDYSSSYSDLICTTKVYKYDESNGRCEWINGDSFSYLRGVDYSSSNRWQYLVSIEQDTTQKSRFNFEGFDKITYSPDLTYINLGYQTSGGKYYPTFTNQPLIYTSGGYYSSFESIFIRAKFRSKTSTMPKLSFYYSDNPYSTNETTDEIKNSLDGKLKNDMVDLNGTEIVFGDGVTNLYFKDKLNVNIMPKVGYVVHGIFKNDGKQSSNGTKSFSGDNVLYNGYNNPQYNFDVDKLKLGQTTLTFEYGFESEVIVLLRNITYSTGIYNASKTLPSGDSGLTYAFEKNSILEYKNEFLKYGYSYTLYTCQNDEEAKAINLDNIDTKKYKQIGNKSYEGLSISLGYDEVIGKSIMDNTISSFYIVVVGTLIDDYKIILHNMVNSYTSYKEYVNQSDASVVNPGGESFLDISGQKITEKIFNVNNEDVYNFKREKNTYFIFEFSSFKDSSTLIESNSFNKQVRPLDSTYKLKFVDFLKLWIENKLNSGESFVGERNINVYSYFTLDTYRFNIYTEMDGMETTDFSITQITNEDTTYTDRNHVHYFSTVTLTAQIKKGFAFVGFYNRRDDKCLSSNYIYKFHNGENSHNERKTSELDIVAKYASYSRVNDSYNVSNNMGVYTLTTANDLVWLSQQVENGQTFAGKTFVLANDIDMTGIKFNPIGSKSQVLKVDNNGNVVVDKIIETPFQGIFDGKNYVISNLKLLGDIGSDLYTTLSYRGLFGFTKNATVKNLTLSEGNISGYSYVGGVVGYAENSKVENVSNYDYTLITNEFDFYDIYRDKLTGDVAANRQYFGGIAGYSKDCYFLGVSNRANVGNNNRVKYIGGLVGYIQMTVEGSAQNPISLDQCFNSGIVSGVDVGVKGDSVSNAYNLAGGLVSSNVVNSYYRGENGNSYGDTYVYNATKSDGTKFSGVYKNVTLDSSFWIVVNGRMTLKIFYWS